MKRTADPAPSYYEPPEQKLTPPICPYCGREVDAFVLDGNGEIAGCPDCTKTVDAWDYMEE